MNSIILAAIAFILLSPPSWGGQKLEEGFYSCALTESVSVRPNSVDYKQSNSTELVSLKVFGDKIIFGENFGFPDAILNEDLRSGDYFYINDWNIKVTFDKNINFMLHHQRHDHFEVGTCNKF
jgi:hypothetical protein